MNKNKLTPLFFSDTHYMINIPKTEVEHGIPYMATVRRIIRPGRTHQQQNKPNRIGTMEQPPSSDPTEVPDFNRTQTNLKSDEQKNT
jgi:hypothetical protein